MGSSNQQHRNFACRMCDPTSLYKWKQIADADTNKELHKHYLDRITDKWHQKSLDFHQ